MKKLYSNLLLAIIFFCGFVANAQSPYQKMIGSNTTDWYIFQDYIPVKLAGTPTVNNISINQGRYSAIGDTFLVGNAYKKMYDVYYTPGFNQNSLIGFIREDSLARKVYFLEKNTTNEIVLYDFSLIQGSNIVLNFPSTSGEFPAGTYSVHSIDTVLTRVGYRKQFKLINSNSDTLVQIESIGSVIHPLYIYQSYYGPGQFSYSGSSACSYPYGLGLACKESNNQKFFQSCTYDLALMNPCIYKYDSCNYYNNCNGIQETASKIQHRIVPNPATDQINLEIELDNEALINVDIFDISGRKLKTLYTGKTLNNNKAIAMDVSGFESGYYFLKIYNKDFNINSPIIITR